MLTTIQELEKEIDLFHKNVKDSNELIEILRSVVSLTKSQTETFNVHTQSLQDELAKLPPELGDLFQEKIEGFVQEMQIEHQAYQSTFTHLMDGYIEKVTLAEASISEVPSELETKMQKEYTENVEELKKIQTQYAADLEKTNGAFSVHLRTTVDNIRTIPEQIQNDSARQYSAFLKELEELLDVRMKQLSETENHVLDLSQQLETKYDAFVTKLEETNMDQLNRYCQEMNKSINTKLNFVLAGVIVAIIVSVIALFI